VDALLQRLGHDVTSLDADEDKVAAQGLGDASERYETASAQFLHAESIPELTVVRGIVVEGLQSCRSVRTRLGLDPGPDLAPPITETPEGQPAHEHSWADMAHSGRGLLGAGAAGGLLGLLGGAVLGGEMGGGFGDGGDWGDGGGGDWGGNDF
jgi:hypothetical protein